MLTLKDKRNQEYEARWRKIINGFCQTNSNSHNNSKTYQEVLSSIEDIEKIEKILNLDVTKSIPNIHNKLTIEIDKLRIDGSFKFFKYIVEEKNIDIEQKVKYFSMGIDCISLALLYSGEALHSLKQSTIIVYIKQLYGYINVWKDINESIEESLTPLHESSLKSLYASLYILENTYRYMNKSEAMSINNKYENSWLQEDKIYESLLENMDDWAQEEWTPEEQEAFTKAMSNL